MNLHDLLEDRDRDGNPVRVGLIGAGRFGTMFLAQARTIPGIHVAAIADINVDRAHQALKLVDWPQDAVTDDLATALADGSTAVLPAEVARLAQELERAGALPGGAPPQAVPAGLAGLWATRDESPERHRDLYTGLARQVELPDPRLADALYDRHMSPAAWRPYPDAGEVLEALQRQAIRAGVISNIGWDVRPVFRAHGLDAAGDAYVLSYEHGIQKPDPALFRVACEAHVKAVIGPTGWDPAAGAAAAQEFLRV